MTANKDNVVQLKVTSPDERINAIPVYIPPQSSNLERFAVGMLWGMQVVLIALCCFMVASA